MVPTPLGAHPTPDGLAVAVHAPHAHTVEFCRFEDGHEVRIPLGGRDGSIHHDVVPGSGWGTRYGFRAHGPGHDPTKLLLDPYGSYVEGWYRWHPALWPGQAGDSAPHVPRSVVVDTTPRRTWDRPRIPWSDTVVYETHVKGISRTHPDLPPALRGTYAALGSEPIVEHLTGLGITTVELLPIARFVHEPKLLSRGLRQYWGYMPIGLMAPHPDYAAATTPEGVVAEVQDMVAALHAAGLEVVLDVVLNHTGEGPEEGPWLSMRGLDERGYYRHRADGTYEDVTGTGNTLDLGYPPALRLALDALRHWVVDYGVDGFRFDLAATLLRTEDSPCDSAFLAAVAQDPILSGVKLIAEPWDLGFAGYRLGGFPHPWREWNDRFRDTVRDAFRGRPGVLPDLATRGTGSSDRFGPPRPPTASINFVTAHDGATLTDLVTYQRRHNEANGEVNHDSGHDQRAWNSGVEGPTDDPAILDLRDRRRRSMMALLLLARGVPMISGGDEIGRTQQGNTNAYCQDGPLSWYDWDHADWEFYDFCRRLLGLRRSQDTLHPDEWLTGRERAPGEHPDVAWLDVDGGRVADWHDPALTTIQMRLDGHPDVVFVANTGGAPEEVTLPPGDWVQWVDTVHDLIEPTPLGPTVTAEPYTVLVLAQS
ncbi:MAG: glycogen debranching protein GlgX [Acidimicrobiia bacterium]